MDEMAALAKIAAVTCDPNNFLHLSNGTVTCRPCPPDSFVNATQHNSTMCTPLPGVQDDTRVWNFLAGQINPYVFLACIMFALGLIIAFACICWRKTMRQVSEFIQDDEVNKRYSSQPLQEKLLLEEEASKSPSLQEKEQPHKIKSFLKFLKNMIHHVEEHQGIIKRVHENV